MIGLIAAMAAAYFGFTMTRDFVRRRLAYVNAVQAGGAPLVAGVLAGAAALPVVGILPLVGMGTAVAFGASVGVGVKAGASETRRRRAGY
ncbi:MAG TPA: hypothetical protein VFQ45_09320 [Longimicrobium sp.]|nr:hypothetical protein [Longimicrobium sp.]